MPDSHVYRSCQQITKTIRKKKKMSEEFSSLLLSAQFIEGTLLQDNLPRSPINIGILLQVSPELINSNLPQNNNTTKNDTFQNSLYKNNDITTCTLTVFIL
jgi:hypothetical protein